jgi:hypothetical protein
MPTIDLFVAFVVATVLVMVLGAGVRRLPVGTVLLGMFAILFLATWAGGIWLAPSSSRPVLPYVVPFIVVGLAMALLITAFIPRYPPRTRGEALRRRDINREFSSFINGFFWLLMVILVASIVLRYLS